MSKARWLETQDLIDWLGLPENDAHMAAAVRLVGQNSFDSTAGAVIRRHLTPVWLAMGSPPIDPAVVDWGALAYSIRSATAGVGAAV